MVRFYQEETQVITLHGDYHENVYYAQKFCDEWQAKHAGSPIRIKLVKTINIDYQYVMFSYTVPQSLPIGPHATPVSLNQKVDDCKKEMKETLFAYRDMDKQINALISHRNADRIDDRG